MQVSSAKDSTRDGSAEGTKCKQQVASSSDFELGLLRTPVSRTILLNYPQRPKNIPLELERFALLCFEQDLLMDKDQNNERSSRLS